MQPDEEKDSQTDIGTGGKWVFKLRITWEIMRQVSSVVPTCWWSLEVPDDAVKCLSQGPT